MLVVLVAPALYWSQRDCHEQNFLSVLVAITGRLANLVYICNVIRLVSTFLLLCVFSQLINLHRLHTAPVASLQEMRLLILTRPAFKRPLQFRCPARHLDVNTVAFIFLDIVSRKRRGSWKIFISNFFVWAGCASRSVEIRVIVTSIQHMRDLVMVTRSLCFFHDKTIKFMCLALYIVTTGWLLKNMPRMSCNSILVCSTYSSTSIFSTIVSPETTSVYYRSHPYPAMRAYSAKRADWIRAS